MGETTIVDLGKTNVVWFELINKENDYYKCNKQFHVSKKVTIPTRKKIRFSLFFMNKEDNYYNLAKKI
jgi:hypothetical protein